MRYRRAISLKSELMPSQYHFLPSMYQTKTLSSASQDFVYLLDDTSEQYLQLAQDNLGYTSYQRAGHLPTSSSNESLMEIPIDTSSLMNSLFPWEDSQFPTHCSSADQLARSSFESSSSTIQGSYCSGNTLLLLDPEDKVVKSNETEPRRESTLLPPNIQDLDSQQFDSYKFRPAYMRSSSERTFKPSQNAKRFTAPSERSATPSQLEAYAGTPEVKSIGLTCTSQRAFASKHSDSRPTTPAPSFASTLIGTPSWSNMSLHSMSKDLPRTPTEDTAPSRITNRKGRSRSSSSNKTAELGPKQVHRTISGPELDGDYPSMMDAGMSLEPRRNTPKPPSSTPLPVPPPIPSIPAEPASYLDWDSDDERPKLNKARSLLNLRSKDTSTNPPKSTKRSSKESSKAATNALVEKSGLRTSSASSTAATRTSQSTAHISLPSPLAPIPLPSAAATLMKKSFVLSKKTKGSPGTKPKKSKKVKTASPPTKSKKMIPRRRLWAWFRKVFY